LSPNCIPFKPAIDCGLEKKIKWGNDYYNRKPTINVGNIEILVLGTFIP